MHALIPRLIAASGLALWLSAGLIGGASAELPRVGFLSAMPEWGPDRKGFQQGLSELGYVEGKNIVIEWRSATTNVDSQAQAEGLVKAKIDLIVASGTPAAHAAMHATTTKPVVSGES